MLPLYPRQALSAPTQVLGGVLRSRLISLIAQTSIFIAHRSALRGLALDQHVGQQQGLVLARLPVEPVQVAVAIAE